MEIELFYSIDCMLVQDQFQERQWNVMRIHVVIFRI